MKYWLYIFLGSLLGACSQGNSSSSSYGEKEAQVISVEATGDPNGYTFVVGISSPDTGCEQYANWWEVLGEDGKLIYRRILQHSHAEEQPFERSGGSVAIEADKVVIVRAHMNNTGYGNMAFKGSVKAGFQEIVLEKDFAKEVEKQEPQPGDCPF